MNCPKAAAEVENVDLFLEGKKKKKKKSDFAAVKLAFMSPT